MLDRVNWITNWYNSNYIKGGLNPIGWENEMDRYWLALFWAIQSITSIGYGNIVPVTTVEYGFANALMLVCGIFWAYIIGNLVEAVTSMGSVTRQYVERMDQANQMVKDFTLEELPNEVTGTTTYSTTSKRVRRFITSQRDKATAKSRASHNGSTLVESYPTLEILSTELQRVCALHLTHSLIETVPYLSSKYLSPEEQAEIALNSVTLQFSSGEQFSEHPELGRGILIFRQGFGFPSRNPASANFSWKRGLSDHPADVNEVLVDDGFQKEKQLVYHFVGFAKVLTKRLGKGALDGDTFKQHWYCNR